VLPRPTSWIKGSLLLRVGDGKGVETVEKKRTGGNGKGREEKRKGGSGR